MKSTFLAGAVLALARSPGAMLMELARLVIEPEVEEDAPGDAG